MNPILRVPAALRPFAFIGAFLVAACGSSEPDRDEPCSIDTSCGTGQYCADGACIAAPEAPIVPIIAAPDTITAGSRGVTASIEAPQAGISYVWTIDGGTITSDAEGDEVRFDVGGGPVVELTVEATNVRGQEETATRTIAVAPVGDATISAPDVVTALRSGLVATVPAQPGASFAWEIAGGTITDGADAASMTFTAGEVGTITLGVIVTNANNDAETTSAEVRVVAPPDATIAAPAFVTVGTEGVSVSVPAQAESTFAWSVNNGTITDGESSEAILLTAGDPGETLVSVTVTNAAGDSTTDTVSIETVPAPSAAITTAVGPITTGTSGVVASVPPQASSTFAWTVTGGTITAGQGTESITFEAGAVGTLHIVASVTNGAGVTATGESTVQIVSAPIAEIAAQATVTEGTAGLVASVPAQADSTFAWTVTNGTIAAGHGTDSIVFTAGLPGPMLLTVTVTNAAGDAAHGQAAIEAFPTPRATLVTVSGPITTGKPGFVASVPAQPGSVYTWAIVGGTITAGQATESITFTAGSVGTLALSATVTNAANASATAEATLDVIAAPDAQVTAPTTVTEGRADLVASVPAQTGSTFAWTVTNGTITAGQGTDSIVFTAGVPGPMLLSVTVTNAAGDAATGQAAIEAFPTPLATLVTVSGPITTGKPGFVASVPAQPGSIYTWAITGGTITAGQGTESITFEAGAVGTLALSVTVTNAANASATAETTLDVIAAPDAQVTTPTTTTEGTAGLVASVPAQAGSTFAWTVTNGTITAGQGTDSIVFTAGVPGPMLHLAVTVTNAAGDAAQSQAAIEVFPTPFATLMTVSGPITTGKGGFVAYVPAHPSLNYVWTVTGGMITAGQQTASITFVAGPVGTLALSVRISNGANASATAEATLDVIGAPDAQVTAPTTTTEGTAGLVASVPAQAGSTFAWTVTNGTITAGQGTDAIVFTAGGVGQLALSVSVTNAAWDRADESRSITVVAAPVATVSAPSEPVTTGTGGHVASVPGQPDSTYSWSISNGTITAGSDTSQIVFTAGSPGQTQIQCTVTNRAGERATEVALTPVVAQPDVTITATEASPVTAGEAGLIASVPQQAGVTYDWTVSGGTITSGAGTHQIVYSAGTAGTLTLEVVVTNAAGDGAAGAHDVTVWAYFSRTGNMTEPRKFTKAVTLTDGRVLVTGGQGMFYDALRSAEIYRPTLATFSAVQAMSTERYSHTATLLDDGKVLIAGGSPGTSAIHSSAELFDPGNDSWTPTGSMAVPRYNHTATLLADGRVLVAGGEQYSGVMNTAEIYDPATGTWSMAGSLATGRTDHSAALLLDGRVLVAGGATTSDQVGSAEIFDPVVGTWSPAGSSATTHAAGTAVRLSDGRVLLAGGETGWIGNSAASEIYDPASGLFTPTPAMITARWGHQTALLGNGRVLQAGGAQNDSHRDSHYYRGLADAEMYDPATDTYLPTLNLAVQRAWAASAVLLDGRVLILGGHTSAIAFSVTYDTTPTAELFHY